MNMLFDRRVKILCIILVFLPWTYYINDAKRHNNLYRPRLLNVLEIPATAENQNPFNYLFCTRLGALSGDVPILSAVVARFITRWLGAVGGNVAGFSAIETTAVRVLLLHNGTLFVLVSCFVGAITGNVSLLVWTMMAWWLLIVIEIGCRQLKLGRGVMTAASFRAKQLSLPKRNAGRCLGVLQYPSW